MKSELMKGPIDVRYSLYADFFNYKGGIYQHLYGENRGGHMVELVGFGKKEDTEYWIAKNSWGNWWGENGYFRIKIGECGIEEWARACEPDV